MGKIVLVDDDSEFLELMLKSLEKAGFEVVSAHSALEALTIIKSNREQISCVLTDYRMPGMRGDELAMTIKHGTGIPVIIMTGDLSVSVETLFKSGISGVIHKPFDSQNFIDFLKNNDLHITQDGSQRKFLRQTGGIESHPITLSNGSDSVDGLILNVSSGGIGVKLSLLLDPSSTVQFTVNIDGIEIKGYMHRRWESRTDGCTSAGFEFDSLTKKILSRNQAFSKWVTIANKAAS